MLIFIIVVGLLISCSSIGVLKRINIKIIIFLILELLFREFGPFGVPFFGHYIVNQSIFLISTIMLCFIIKDLIDVCEVKRT